MAAELPTPVPLSYSDRLAERDLGDIDLVVIHCTELPDLRMAREYGEKIHYTGSGTGRAGHFYINRDGHAETWVDIGRVAHHVRGFNERSIGIELVNRGRWPEWLHSEYQEMTERYPAAQIDTLLELLETLCARLPRLRWISGHEALDTQQVPASDDAGLSVFRKRDPGPMFPWTKVLSASHLDRFGG